MTEYIVAVFETEAAAEAATESLRSAGIPASAIRQYAGSAADRQPVPTEQTSVHTSDGGFWSWLFGEDSTTETTRSAYTHDAYDRRASAGNVVVSVTVAEDAKIHSAIAALEAHNPLNIDERSDEVAEVGAGSTMAPLTGASTTGREFSTEDSLQARTVDTAIPSGRVDVAGAPETSPPIPSGRTGREMAEGEQVLSLSEEQLAVGKRTVDLGATRVRRYVVEKPVEENVTLRGERVTVERRQPIETTASGMGAFEERIVEVRETSEEPVVAKTAHVVEEVVIGREATERTETVKETVRREEVEVSKDVDLKP